MWPQTPQLNWAWIGDIRWLQLAQEGFIFNPTEQRAEQSSDQPVESRSQKKSSTEIKLRVSHVLPLAPRSTLWFFFVKYDGGHDYNQLSPLVCIFWTHYHRFFFGKSMSKDPHSLIIIGLISIIPELVILDSQNPNPGKLCLQPIYPPPSACLVPPSYLIPPSTWKTVNKYILQPIYPPPTCLVPPSYLIPPSTYTDILHY